MHFRPGQPAAPLVAVPTERAGRRRGLALGLAAGVVGGAIAVGGILAASLLLFLGGLLLMGVASAAMMLERFAAAEVTRPQRRGRAISMVVVGGAAGSVLGPLLVGPSGRLAAGVGLDELAGPFAAALLILTMASLSLVRWLRPDPHDVGRKMAEKHPEPTVVAGTARSIVEILRTPSGSLAIAAMASSQWVVVTPMVECQPSGRGGFCRHGLLGVGHRWGTGSPGSRGVDGMVDAQDGCSPEARKTYAQVIMRLLLGTVLFKGL